MNSKETNALLRQMFNQLVDVGWAKTNIGKALLGDNGQGHVNHWLNTSNEKLNDFGIKPLTNIADQIKYDLHLVFLPRDDKSEIQNQIDKLNEEFIEKLKTALHNYLGSNIPKPSYTKNAKSKIDKVLDDLLGISSDNEDEAQGIDQNDLAPEEQ